MASFTFDTSIDRNGREYDVEVTYAVTGSDWAITATRCAVDLTDYDFECIDDVIADRIDEDMAEWRADYSDHLHDLARDRAAESYIPQVTL